MVSQIKVNEIIKQSGSSITIGESGDTINIGTTGDTINLAGSAYATPGNMTPIFLATGGTAQSGLSDNTTTLRIFNSEIYDTDNAYDTSTGLFTVPTTGKYVLIAGLNIDGGSNTGTEFALGLSLNSDASANGHTFLNFNSASLKRWDANITVVRSLTANDTVGVYGRMNTSSGDWNMYSGTNTNYFGAFRIIES